MINNNYAIKVIFLFAILSNFAFETKAQSNEVVVRIPIAENIVNEGDSIFIVAINLQPFSNIEIKEKTLGVLYKNYKNNANYLDSIVAIGRCYLIKNNNYYFGLKLKGDIKPEPNDLILFKATLPTCYDGLLFGLSKCSILFTTVDDKEFYNVETPYLLKKVTEEEKYFNHMVNDIKYTGKTMENQMPTSNVMLTGDLYKGEKLFTAMQKTTINDLKEFLKYVKARRKNYAGNTWKISETYATWLNAGAPMVIEN